MAGIRQLNIRIVLVFSIVACASAMIDLSAAAQENSNHEQVRQVSLDYLNSFVFKNDGNDGRCDQCEHCKEICLNIDEDRQLNSIGQDMTAEDEEWQKLWFANHKLPAQASCKGLECTEPCDNPDCMNGKLSKVGLITEVAESPNDCGASCCEKRNCDDCEICLDQRTMPINSAYCRDMADLLCASLEGKGMDDQQMRRAVDKALTLVSKHAKSESLTEMAKLQSIHEQEMASMRGQVLQLSTQVHTVNDLRNWIGPLYTNQNRTIQHIQMMSASSNALNRTLALLEKQLSSKPTPAPAPIKYANPHVVQDESKSDVYYLKRQVNQLQQQLRQMQMQSDKIQPAQHLQPIYNSFQPLEPLDSTFPSTINWAPKKQRR